MSTHDDLVAEAESAAATVATLDELGARQSDFLGKKAAINLAKARELLRRALLIDGTPRWSKTLTAEAMGTEFGSANEAGKTQMKDDLAAMIKALTTPYFVPKANGATLPIVL